MSGLARAALFLFKPPSQPQPQPPPQLLSQSPQTQPTTTTATITTTATTTATTTNPPSKTQVHHSASSSSPSSYSSSSSSPSLLPVPYELPLPYVVMEIYQTGAEGKQGLGQGLGQGGVTEGLGKCIYLLCSGGHGDNCIHVQGIASGGATNEIHPHLLSRSSSTTTTNHTSNSTKTPHNPSFIPHQRQDLIHAEPSYLPPPRPTTYASSHVEVGLSAKGGVSSMLSMKLRHHHDVVTCLTTTSGTPNQPTNQPINIIPKKQPTNKYYHKNTKPKTNENQLTNLTNESNFTLLKLLLASTINYLIVTCLYHITSVVPTTLPYP